MSKRINQVTYQGVKYTRKNLAYVEMIVNRQHVSVSNFELVRLFYPKVKRYPRKLRHMVYQYAIECHNENRGLYQFVMSGGHGYTGRK